MSGNGKRICIDVGKVMGLEEILRIAQMPPDIGIAYSAARHHKFERDMRIVKTRRKEGPLRNQKRTSLSGVCGRKSAATCLLTLVTASSSISVWLWNDKVSEHPAERSNCAANRCGPAGQGLGRERGLAKNSSFGLTSPGESNCIRRLRPPGKP